MSDRARDFIQPDDLERFERLWAIRATNPSDDGSRWGALAAPGDVALDREAWHGLRTDRWRLVTPSRSTIGDLREGRLPSGADEALMVYRAPPEHLFLAAWRATLFFDPALSDAHVRRLLDEAGLRALRPYDWHPGAWSVAIPRDEEPTDWTRSLGPLLGRALVHAMPELLGCYDHRVDPTYDVQWQWKNTGQNGGTPHADIHAEGAWAITSGKFMRIAVLDKYFRPSHRDIKDGIHPYSGHFDGAGEGGFEMGADAIAQDGSGADHGTPCAALAAGRTSRGRTCRGAAPGAQLLLITLGSWTSGELFATAIRYAADVHVPVPPLALSGLPPSWPLWRLQPRAHVITCSMAPLKSSFSGGTLVTSALAHIGSTGRHGRGTPFFWALRNGSTHSTSEDFIATDPHVICVGKTTRTDVDPGHAHGPDVDFVAPGHEVPTAEGTGDSDFAYEYGTSFATPIAAAVGALVLAANPLLTADHVRLLLRHTCDKVGGDIYGANGHHEMYGFGRIDAKCAVEGSRLLRLLNFPPAPVLPFAPSPPGPLPIP